MSQPISPTAMLDAALLLAARGWEVFPLLGKVPAIGGGRGVKDATRSEKTIRAWWGPRPGANIGARVPERLVVVDVDPRNGGAESLAQLEAEHGPLPATVTVWSGRGDGGRHTYWLRPPGKLTGRQLPPGIDLKTSAGYCVVPPSVHPEGQRQPYRWQPGAFAVPPAWLVDLLVEPARPAPAPRSALRLVGDSPIAAFNEATTWHGLLDRHGWTCSRGDGESDGSVWLHPAATSSCSATITGGRLYVYSTNTPFETTEAGRPSGYDRFAAWTVLEHGGDARAALQYLRTTGAVA